MDVPGSLLYPLIVVLVACASAGAHDGQGPSGGGQEQSGGGDAGASAGGEGNGSGPDGAADAVSSGTPASSGGASSGVSGSSGSGPIDGASGADVEGGGGDAGAGEAGATDCASLPLCDDFESDTPGAAPSPSLWKVVMGCNPNMQNVPVDGGLTVGIDDSESHSGKNSLRVVGGDSCGYYAVNTSAFSALTGGTLYARFWARFSGAPTPDHNGFLTMSSPTDAGTSTNQLRIGFQDNIIDWNWFGSDSTLPDLDPLGAAQSTATQATTWACIELSVESATGTVQFWLNGALVPGLSYTAGQPPTSGVDDGWASSGPKPPVILTSFGLGWLGLNNMYTVWFDDVALSDSRIGCQ